MITTGIFDLVVFILFLIVVVLSTILWKLIDLINEIKKK